MRVRMRRKANISSVLQTNSDISNSLQNHWVSAILFGFFTLIAVPTGIAEQSGYSITVAVLVTLVFVNSITGILELKRLRSNLKSDPKRYAGTPVKQPLLYRAVFWYLPK